MVFYAENPIKEYKIVIGADPKNDKLREGDYLTPEGEFHVKALYPHKSQARFIWIDYPTEESWQKHKQAMSQGLLSKKDTIGGEIGIHGVPFGNDLLVDKGLNWTAGCISLKTADILEIYDVVEVGTPVIIKH